MCSWTRCWAGTALPDEPRLVLEPVSLPPPDPLVEPSLVASLVVCALPVDEPVLLGPNPVVSDPLVGLLETSPEHATTLGSSSTSNGATLGAGGTTTTTSSAGSSGGATTQSSSSIYQYGTGVFADTGFTASYSAFTCTAQDPSYFQGCIDEIVATQLTSPGCSVGKWLTSCTAAEVSCEE